MKQCTQHIDKYVTHICTYRGQCGFRQACQDCIEEQIHQHERHHTYLIEINRFNQNLMIVSPQYINQLKSHLLVTQKLVKQIQLLFDCIQKIIKYEETHQLYIQNNYNISILDDQQLYSLFSLDQDSTILNNIDNHINSIQILTQNLNSQEIQFEIFPCKPIISIKEYKPIISENEKYLGLVNQEKSVVRFNIVSILKNKCYYDKKINKAVDIISFSNDLKFVILFDPLYVNIYLTKSLKPMFKQNRVEEILTNVCCKWINNYQFITKDDSGIYVYNILKRRALKINVNQTDSPLEYDSENNLIVVCKGNNILFYYPKDQKDYFVWEHKIAIQGEIEGMQIIDKGQNLITLNQNYLTVWQVDHNMQWLQPIQEFHHQNMLEFRFINNDQIFIIRENDKIIITDIYFRIKYQLRIQLCRSVLQSINYLIIEPQFGNFLVLKNQIKHM